MANKVVTTANISIEIQKTFVDQAEILARHLNISPNQLFERAIEHYIRTHKVPALLDESKPNLPELPSQDAKVATPMGRDTSVINHPVINQGDIFWVQIEDSNELETAIPHPYVVIQENLLNHSRINTIVACALTSNLRRVSDTPGNLLLEPGEANLPKQSVVEVSKVSSIDKAQVGEYIGSLTEPRINQILAGMRFLQQSYFAR